MHNNPHETQNRRSRSLIPTVTTAHYNCHQTATKARIFLRNKQYLTRTRRSVQFTSMPGGGKGVDADDTYVTETG